MNGWNGRADVRNSGCRGRRYRGFGKGCSDTSCDETPRVPSLTAEHSPRFQLLEIGRDVNAQLPLPQRTTGGKQQMKAAVANLSYIPWLNVFVVGLRSRLPSDRTHSGWICKGGSNDEPQSVPMVQLKHPPRVGRHQIWIGMVSELTCGIYPNMTVRRTWEAVDGGVELLIVGKGMAIGGF